MSERRVIQAVTASYDIGQQLMVASEGGPQLYTVVEIKSTTEMTVEKVPTVEDKLEEPWR